VRTLTVDGDRQIYDSTIEPHHHFYNVDTGELTDIPLAAVSLDRLPAAPDGTSEERVDVIIRIRNG
jgi:Fur family iron response transcriptional regulator